MQHNVDVTSTAFECGETKLYHYQRFRVDHLQDILRNRHVYCSTAGNLNDPWDCRPWFDTEGLRDPEVRRSVGEWFVGQANRAKTAREKLHDHLVLTDEFTGRQALKALSTHIEEIIRKNWRIYCLTPYGASTLMWSHYAENHRGMCLEFAVAPDTVFGGARKVEYFARYPAFLPHQMEKTAVDVMLSKAECWSYEREYRILVEAPNRPLPRTAAVLRNDRLVFPEGALVSVIVECEMSKDECNEVRQLVSDITPNVAFKRMRRRRNRYELQDPKHL